ncbi:MAG: response regulator [Alphaproteobacteria bacterium]|nr:response regulator [Alphaproteobacteria bacterium]
MTTPNKNPEPLRVLLVDDSPQSLNLVKRMLHDLGSTQIFTAKNGAEALSLIGSFDGDDFIDLVLCDWNMPVMSGMELLRQIRTCDPDLLFYMITGQADRSSIVEAKAHGINGYIKKPFSPDELRKKLIVASRVISHRKLEAAAV